LSGGRRLFTLLVSVDVALGPFLTFVVYNKGKSLRHLFTDLSLIALLQLAAFGYGIWTVFEARPVYLAFEIDRIRIVHAVDVSEELLHNAPTAFKELPRKGPELIAVRPFASNSEKAEATMAALGGVEMAFRPEFWVPYENARASILLASKPIGELQTRKPAASLILKQAMDKLRLSPENLRYLPLHGRNYFWTALIDANSAKPVAYLPIDPY
jgi:hypothetical protein